MSVQQNIRFPEDLHAAISAEAERRGKPWTFSSVLIEWAERGGSCQNLTFCLAKPARDPQTYAQSLGIGDAYSVTAPEYVAVVKQRDQLLSVVGRLRMAPDGRRMLSEVYAVADKVARAMERHDHR